MLIIRYQRKVLNKKKILFCAVGIKQATEIVSEVGIIRLLNF